MRLLRSLAIVFLVVVAIAALGAGQFSTGDYAKQFRNTPNAPPSRSHWLGTDQLGRDCFIRAAYGTRVSLLLAPAAALLSLFFAALFGGVAGYLGGAVQTIAMAVTDLFLSLPWFFLLITVRALLPLNASPFVSVTVTFCLIGILGWATSARVLCAGAVAVRNSSYVFQARANGVSPWRIAFYHVLPNLRPLLLAQFWISVPVYILSEANLGMLGLGVAEPLPSWGSLMRELEDLTVLSSAPWRIVPFVMLLAVVGSFELLLSGNEVNS